ncbi:MAG: type II secretion system F family protein [Candidatus Woesearchaeota archaeon]
MSIFKNLGEAIIPKNIRLNLKKYLAKTGNYNVPYSQYGFVFFLSIILTITSYFLFAHNYIKKNSPFAVGISSFIILTITEFITIGLIFLIYFLYYEFVIFNRTREIENVLPDFLDDVSVNLRSGMSFDKALWNSIAPQYGILEKEIEIVAKKVMAGYDTEEALKEFAEKYNSTLLQESIDMIIVGLKSGTNISELIEKIAENVKDAYYLKKELIASVTSFVIFIAFTAVIISPILFSLSFNLMTIIQNLGEKLSITSSYNVLPFNFKFKTIQPKDFILFSKICIIIISTISAMIIADLREGSIKAGLKYIFLFVPISYFVYIISLNLLSSLFSIII